MLVEDIWHGCLRVKIENRRLANGQMLIGCSPKQRVVLASRSDSGVAVNICEIKVRFLDSRQEDIPVPLKVRVQCGCATLWRTNNKKIGTLQDWLSPQKVAISVSVGLDTGAHVIDIVSAKLNLDNDVKLGAFHAKNR